MIYGTLLYESLSIGSVFAIAFALVIAFVLLVVFSTGEYNLKEWFFFIFRKKILITENESEQIGEYLKEIHYFNQLSLAGKERFISRTHFVMKRIRFSSSNVFELTLKNKVLIASSIVQITFGLKHFYIHTITHIRIFQKEIMNPRTRQQFYGLMFTSGKMYLSWERFQRGIQISNDGVNLGLHETTHGLLILLKHHKLNFDEFEFMLEGWYKMAERHIVSNDNKEGFFRKYASANRDEFFSVLVENFFERPAEFKQLMPVLYDEVCVYFYQDPLNASNDFRINLRQEALVADPAAGKDGSVKPLNLIQDKWHWSFTVIVLMGYFSFVANIIIKDYIASSFITIFIAYLIAFPIVYRLLRKPFIASGRMGKRNYTVMSIFSMSPVIVMLLMVLSIAIPVSGEISEKYTVKSAVKTLGIVYSSGDISFLEKKTTYYELDQDDSYSIPARSNISLYALTDTLVIKYHYGITGLKVFDGNASISAEKDTVPQNQYTP
ncbi:MAG TPA: zinc-dependent peptidase [Bacteroidia bacterium]